VIRAAFAVDGTTELNRSYRELARFYGFKIDPTLRTPEEEGQGRVERQVRQGNFFAGREESDVDELRPELARWTRDIAGMREHGTTHQRPLEAFLEVEKAALLPLPAKPYELVLWRCALAHRLSSRLRKRLYSAPWTLIGQSLWVRATKNVVTIFAADDERVATHDRNGPGPGARSRRTCQSIVAISGIAAARTGRSARRAWRGRGELRPRGLRLRQRTLAASRGAGDRHAPRKVSGGESRAACARAHFFANYTYQGVRNILQRALDLQPLPVLVAQPSRPTTWRRALRDRLHRGCFASRR